MQLFVQLSGLSLKVGASEKSCRLLMHSVTIQYCNCKLLVRCFQTQLRISEILNLQATEQVFQLQGTDEGEEWGVRVCRGKILQSFLLF